MNGNYAATTDVPRPEIALQLSAGTGHLAAPWERLESSAKSTNRTFLADYAFWPAPLIPWNVSKQVLN